MRGYNQQPVDCYILGWEVDVLGSASQLDVWLVETLLIVVPLCENLSTHTHREREREREQLLFYHQCSFNHFCPL